MSWGRRLQSLPKPLIYLILILATSIPLFKPFKVPNVPQDAAIDLYASLMQLPTDRPVLIASDWTGSTRGESKGAFRAIVKILIRRGIKFAIYSTGGPEAPQVARDAIAEINAERRAKNQSEFKQWTDWVMVGYFAGSEATTNGIATDIRATFKGAKDVAPGQGLQPVLTSPVFQGITKVQDFASLILITASKTSNFTIERIPRKSMPLAMAVTGVMVPETQNFYQAGQIVGFAGGLKGVYDLETMMEVGVNDPNSKDTVKSDKWQTVPGWPGEDNVGQATAYYPTLHFAMALMILMIVLGNIGMFLSKKGARR
jgi:hypothetical protein